MRQSGRAMHIVATRREYKGKIYETHLLQRSYREDGKVKHETLANLSHLPAEIVTSIRAQLKGEKLVSADALFVPVGSKPHGHVRAAWGPSARWASRRSFRPRRAASEDELCAAMDWLDERQGRIEKKLAKRHLADGSLALYDLSSSYFEGETCPLVKDGVYSPSAIAP